MPYERCVIKRIQFPYKRQPKQREPNETKYLPHKINTELTFADDVRVSRRVLAAIECECRFGLASVGAVVVGAVVPDAFVT